MKQTRLTRKEYTTGTEWHIEQEHKGLFCKGKWISIYSYKKYEKAKAMFDRITGTYISTRVIETR